MSGTLVVQLIDQQELGDEKSRAGNSRTLNHL
jgi:hypothetical protein